MILPDDYLSDPAYKKMEGVFLDYVRQGDGRKVTWVAEATGLPLTVVTRGMVKGMWMQRIEEIGRDAAKKSRETLVNDVGKLNEYDLFTLTECIEVGRERLLEALKDDRVPPATLAKLIPQLMQMRRDLLGLDNGSDDLAGRMQKLLAAMEKEDAESFVLDRKKLLAPVDLPAMPGMTSDAELTDAEKEMLSGQDQ